MLFLCVHVCVNSYMHNLNYLVMYFLPRVVCACTLISAPCSYVRMHTSAGTRAWRWAYSHGCVCARLCVCNNGKRMHVWINSFAALMRPHALPHKGDGAISFPPRPVNKHLLPSHPNTYLTWIPPWTCFIGLIWSESEAILFCRPSTDPLGWGIPHQGQNTCQCC